jgi:hypothetical protein
MEIALSNASTTLHKAHWSQFGLKDFPGLRLNAQEGRIASRMTVATELRRYLHGLKLLLMLTNLHIA